MLEKVNLSQKTSKDDYRNKISELEKELGSLLRRAKELKIPLAIAFEGWGAAGKGTVHQPPHPVDGSETIQRSPHEGAE